MAPPDAAGSSVVAWAPADGGVVVAKLADGGYSAQMKPIPVGPIDDGEVEVVIDGVAFGPRPGLVLILATHAAEDAEAHQLLAVDAGASPVDSPTNPPLASNSRAPSTSTTTSRISPDRFFTPRPSRSGGWR